VWQSPLALTAITTSPLPATGSGRLAQVTSPRVGKIIAFIAASFSVITVQILVQRSAQTIRTNYLQAALKGISETWFIDWISA
jgi:hypothetical protein